MPTDPEHARRLSLAQADARRRRHRTTNPAHLLAVLLEIDAEAQAVHDRGLDPRELLERTEAHFTTLPVTGVYRDGCEAPRAPTLDRVVRRMQGRSWLPFGRVTMLESVLLEPSVCELIVGLRRGADCRYVVERAKARAIASSHRRVGLEHVVGALVDLPSFTDLLADAGGDTERLRSFLDETERPADSDHREAPTLETPVRRVLYAGDVPEADNALMTIRQLAIVLARTSECDRFWQAAGTSPSRLLYALHVPLSHRPIR